MAKARKQSNHEAPPDPQDREAFENWLSRQPREWSVAIAARAALRALPFIVQSGQPDQLALPLFRAAAIARFAAKYPAVNSPGLTQAASAAAAAAAMSTGGVSAVAAAASYAVVHFDAAKAASAASTAVVVAGPPAAAVAAKQDAWRLHGGAMTVPQLVVWPLWSGITPPPAVGEWRQLTRALRADGDHWSAWIDWYDDILIGAYHIANTRAEDAAFTDLSGNLPWKLGARAVNMQIVRRLQELRGDGEIQPSVSGLESNLEDWKTRTIAQLAYLASPQPSITEKNQLDAGPNQPFDLPDNYDDLSTLPLRQRNLIKGILFDLPANAPRHLKAFLQSYDDELKSRGVQPILGLLQDNAEIVAAAVSASRAGEEWLEPGMREAFNRFAANHAQFVEHFPLDADREALYANTPVNEAEVIGNQFIEPFERVAEAARATHQAGMTTDDFMMVIDKMTEFARVVSTQPPAPPSGKPSSVHSAEIKVAPEDRLEPITTKKRVVLGALGFFERTYNLIGTTVTVTTASYVGLPEALRSAIEILSRLLH